MANDKTKVTIKELQTFIDAVEFAADAENWIPSERQWKRIRDMINNLGESQVAPPPPQPMYQQHMGPAVMAPGGMASAPAFPPHMQQMPVNPSSLAGPFASDSGVAPVRTPTIDTSHGKPYQSSFA